MTCAGAELALEQRLGGALPFDGAASLDEHLAGCAACRAYAEVAARSSAALAAAGAEAVAGADWDRIEASLRRQRHSAVRRVALDLLTSAVVVPLGLYGLVPPERRAAVLAPLLAAAAASALWRAAYHGWLARRAAALDGLELVAFHRAELRADLRRSACGRWLAAAAVIALACCALVLGATWRERLAFGALGLVVAGTWVYVLAVRVPRLRRQLEALGPERGGP